jgi:hypothetical protein
MALGSWGLGLGDWVRAAFSALFSGMAAFYFAFEWG